MDKKPLFVVSAHWNGTRLGWYYNPTVTVREDLDEAVAEAEKLAILGGTVLLSRVEMQWGPGIDSKQGE